MSRRETRLNGRKPDGWWRFTHYRVRSVADFSRIANFPRCPERARQIAQSAINRVVAEARRYSAPAQNPPTEGGER